MVEAKVEQVLERLSEKDHVELDNHADLTEEILEAARDEGFELTDEELEEIREELL